MNAERDASCCPGCGHSCCPNKRGHAALECGGDSDAVNACTDKVDFGATLASLVSEHAGHGFAGFMRGALDGCQVYVAAAALQDALRECDLPPAKTGDPS